MADSFWLADFLEEFKKVVKRETWNVDEEEPSVATNGFTLPGSPTDQNMHTLKQHKGNKTT